MGSEKNLVKLLVYTANLLLKLNIFMHIRVSWAFSGELRTLRILVISNSALINVIFKLYMNGL